MGKLARRLSEVEQELALLKRQVQALINIAAEQYRVEPTEQPTPHPMITYGPFPPNTRITKIGPKEYKDALDD